MIATDGMIQSCPLCRASNPRVAFRLPGYQIAACPECDFLFNGDFSGGGDEGELFSEDYYQVAHGAAFKPQLEDYAKDPSAAVFDRWLEKIEQRISPGRLLDVGCALGTFLKIAQKRGWECHGVEISQYAAEHARRTHGLDVFNGDLENFDGTNGSFDVITFWDSVEHVRYPLENLQTANRLLCSGGLALFTTDNFDCLIADLARRIYQITCGRVSYPMRRVFIDRNFAFFTEATFRSLVDRIGWHIIEFEKMEYPLDKIETNWAERSILKSFYRVAALTGRQAQFTVLAEKKVLAEKNRSGNQ